MSSATLPATYYIGWDVGGWNCSKSSNSCDAIVVLDAQGELVGEPMRGNIRDSINDQSTAREWLDALFTQCAPELQIGDVEVVMAIDAPLGYPVAFSELMVGRWCNGRVSDNNSANPYLFRRTETFLFDHGYRPLSAIRDQLGSQSTKAMHVLAKFGLKREDCGVWRDKVSKLTVIETYPAVCGKSDEINKLLQPHLRSHSSIFNLAQHEEKSKTWYENKDRQDALICALMAHQFNFNLDWLALPLKGIPESEGWIWVPQEALKDSATRPALLSGR